MPAKIIDQFTDLPVSRAYKWQLRHPDQYADIRYNVNLRVKHKRRAVAVVKKRDWSHSMDKTAKLAAEAKRHQSKGRSIADIMVWMNLPESKVRELLA